MAKSNVWALKLLKKLFEKNTDTRYNIGLLFLCQKLGNIKDTYSKVLKGPAKD